MFPQMLKMDFQRDRWKSIFARWGRTPNPVNSPVAGAGCAFGSRTLLSLRPRDRRGLRPARSRKQPPRCFREKEKDGAGLHPCKPAPSRSSVLIGALFLLAPLLHSRLFLLFFQKDSRHFLCHKVLLHLRPCLSVCRVCRPLLLQKLGILGVQFLDTGGAFASRAVQKPLSPPCGA